MQVRARDLQVISEDVVEAHFERLNAGALSLARLNLRDVLAPVQAQIAQFVEFGMVPGANGSSIGDGERRLVGDRLENRVGDVGQFVQSLVERA